MLGSMIFSFEQFHIIISGFTPFFLLSYYCFESKETRYLVLRTRYIYLVLEAVKFVPRVFL